MRILHVIRSLDPLCGGPPALVRDLVPTEVGVGHEVELVATTAQASGQREERNVYLQRVASEPSFAGAEVSFLKAFGRLCGDLGGSLAFTPGARRWFRKRLADRRHRPDLVVICGLFTHLLSVAASECRRQGIPYVIAPFGSLDSEPLSMGCARLKRLFIATSLKRDVAHMAVMQVSSQFEAQQLPDWVPAERVRVIPHGVDIPDVDSVSAAEAFWAKFPNLRERRIVLCMSRIDPIKQINVLIEAMALLREEFPDLALVIAGKDSGHLDSLRSLTLERGLQECVVFAGFLQNQLKEGAFAAAKIFALPSMHENFGIAVVEALGRRVPVLVTPEVASHVFADESDSGLTVPGNPEAFADGIRSLLAADRQAMGRTRASLRQKQSFVGRGSDTDESALRGDRRAWNTETGRGTHRWK